MSIQRPNGLSSKGIRSNGLSSNGLIRVLGVDPGSVITGYGLIESDGARSFHLTHGHIRVKGENFPEKLGHIHAALGDIINEWQPQEAAIEQDL